MKKIISKIPPQITILSSVTMIVTIALFIYSLFAIKIKDAIYTGSIKDIKIEQINKKHTLFIDIDNKTIKAVGTNELIKFISKYDNTQCIIYVERELAYFLF